VIKKTNETAGRVFPVMLDVENPDFTGGWIFVQK
jgi:magnesium-protoporphyrin IX monomethyl ester (oxidative) cyclase